MSEDSDQPAARFLLKALSNLLMGIAAFSFLFGGRLLAEFVGMDRLLGEMIGIGVAVLGGVLWAVAKSAPGD